MKDKYNFWMLNHYAGNLEQGMEYRHFFLARHLRRLGHRVSIVASTFSHLFSSPPKTDRWIEKQVYDGVEFVWLKGPRYQGNGIWRLANMLTYSSLLRLADLRKHIGTPNVVMGSTPHPFVTWNTLQIGRKYKIPAIVEVRDLWPLMLVELGSISEKHLLTKLFYRMEQASFAKANKIVSLWHSTDQYMMANGVDKNRYMYLPNGIELEDEFYKKPHPLLDLVEEAKQKGKFLIGYGGSHGHANPLKQVLEACKTLEDNNRKDIHFFMVGDGPDKTAAIERSQSLGLTNITWFDSVPKAVVMSFYKALDATFIGLRDLPLFKYGPTPNKLMDYLAVGKPIIYAIRSSYNPIKEHDLGVSIDPDDGTQLAEAILKLQALAPEKRQEMGTRARDYAQKEHSYEALANRLDDMIQKLL